MKKYCYFMASNPYWLGVAKELYKKNIAKPVLWVGDDIHYKEAKKIFVNGVYKRDDLVHYPFTLKVNNYKSENHNFIYSINYSRAKDRCIKMMDRLDFYGNFTRLDREATFHRLVIFLLGEIYNSKPDMLIMSENAHSHPQYLILEICKFLQIPIGKFNSWGFVSPLMFMQNEVTGEIMSRNLKLDENLKNTIKNNLNEFIEITIARKINDGYVSKLIIDQKKSFLRQLKLKKLLNRIKYNLKYEFFQFRKAISSDYYVINPNKLNFFIRNKVLEIKAKNIKKMCLDSQTKIFPKKEFVYFALHFEPERSTNPDGGFYHDQFLALMTLRKIVPNDIEILVKEHPTQFLVKRKGTLGRSPLFYQLIKNLNGVRLIDLDTDSYKLIKNSKFVSTITGTVALETALMGNKALIFGDAWYGGCPNIISWEESISYQEIINKETKNYKEIEKFLDKFINKNCFPGCINETTKDKFSSIYNANFKKNEFENIKNLITEFILTN